MFESPGGAGQDARWDRGRQEAMARRARQRYGIEVSADELAGGFSAGWHALRVAVSWTLAFLGAIAPFAVVLAVAGYLVYRGRRRLTRRRPAAGAASPES